MSYTARFDTVEDKAKFERQFKAFVLADFQPQNSRSGFTPGFR